MTRIRRHRIVMLVSFAILLGSASFTRAEIEWSSRLPAEYRAWKIETRGGQELEISQVYIPIVGTLAIQPATRLVVSAAAGHSQFDRPVVSTEGEVGPNESDALTGATDVKLQIYQKVWRERLVLLGGVNLPTGKRELSREELEVMQAAAHPLLGMRLKQYGRGLDLNAGAALSIPVDRGLEVGLGAGYLLSGKYTLAENGQEYEPTPEASASVAVEMTSPGREHTMQFRVTGRLYQEDQLAGRKIFEEGDQLEAALRGSVRNGRVRSSLVTQVVWKKDDNGFGLSGPVGRVSTTTPGTGIMAHASALYAVNEILDAGIAGDWKRFQVSDVADYNGDAFGVGPSFGVRVGSGSARVEGLVLTGSAGENSGELDLSGFAISASLLWRP